MGGGPRIDENHEPQKPQRPESPSALVKQGLAAVEQALQDLAETQEAQTVLLQDVHGQILATLETTAFIRGHTNELVRQAGQGEKPAPADPPRGAHGRLLTRGLMLLVGVTCLGIGAWLQGTAGGASVEHRLMGAVDCILVTHQSKLPAEVLAQLEQAYRGQQVQTLTKRKGKGCF